MKRLVMLVLAITAFGVGYTAFSAHAWPVFGRNANYGYFSNINDNAGTNVLPTIYDGNTNAIPNYVDSAAEFIAFIQSQFNGSNQQRIGAGFIVDTMSGGPHSYPPSGQEMAQWQNDVYWYEAQGWINWGLAFNHSVNSYYQGTGAGSNPNDDAFYPDSATSTSITFTGPGGWIRYGIRRQCANPVGTGGLASIASRVFSISGRSTVSNPTPSPGATITFQHYIKDNGDDTWPVQIWAISEQTSPTLVGTGGPANFGSMTAGQEINVFNHNTTIPLGTPGGTQYCERVGWTPINSVGDANGRGTPVCATVQNADYTLTPSVGATVNGTSTSTAEPNDTIVFTFVTNNAGPGPSSSVACSIYGLKKDGYYTAPTPADSTSDSGYSPPATGCPQNFPVGSTTIATQNVIVAAGDINKTICRSLYVNPASATTGSVGAEACVRIAAKPYLRVYGGDVSAGNAYLSAGTCSSNGNASVVGWNKRTTGGANYAGAGTQYANIALGTIYDHAANLGTTGGAPLPTGVAFANTVGNIPNGQWGGSFGSVPCIPDYFAAQSGTVALGATTDVASLASGNYTFTGNTRLHGSLGANRQVSIFIDGNVLIDGNILYPANWTASTTPLFKLVVRGNIYISRTATRVDGAYIAQPNGSNGGIVYTCANPALPVASISPASGTYFADCNSKLTINGSFVARQVQFLRTAGSLGQSTAAETAASGAGAEVFNYSPALWMARPAGLTASNSYDAIVSLPPVL